MIFERTKSGVFVLALLHVVSGPIAAQNSEDQPRLNPVCMVKELEDGGQLPVVLPAGDQQAMKIKGFQVQPCAVAFGSRFKIEEWRNFICQIASDVSEARQTNFEQKWGERPAVLCGMAELTSSQWQRVRKQ